MKLIDFARRLEVTQGTVTRWKRRGWVVLFPDGNVDVETSEANLKKYRRPVDIAGKMETIRRKKGLPSPEPKPVPTVPHLPQDAAGDATRAAVQAGLVADIGVSKQIEAHYRALQQQLDYEKDSDQLIDRVAVERKVFGLAKQQRDAWLHWPARVAPLLAADLDVDADKMLDALSKLVHAHVTELGTPEKEISDAGK